ncbi:MAG: corrinoid protein [Gemmatimonadetes bacterium]|nr:corrinoid protein [Gemmatimonadota bacterium]NNM04809.1 corrinoid protein [Gemmatimonadota bacterium]
MEILERIAKSLMAGDDTKIVDEVTQAMDEGIAAAEILDNGLIAGMNVVGVKFRDHQMFLPEVLLSARAMTAGVALLKPLLIAENVPSRGKVVLGSVQGDLHDIGKNLVGIMLEGAGFEVVDLGIDVPPERFIDAAISEDASVVGLSSLLTTTMEIMKGVVDLVGERGLSDKVQVIVGGAPLSEEFAQSIGADGYAYDAANAVERVIALTRET